MASSVLIVEDTELLRRMYADKLQQEGFKVLSAADGLEALSLLRSETPDLILLDLVMPNMSGLEVLETLRKDDRLSAIPVLILSNPLEDADMERAMELGAVDYLIKSEMRLSDVAARIAEVLSSPADGSGSSVYSVYLRDHEGDTDGLVEAAGLRRRFWCPACEVELALRMHPRSDRPGWYDAHFVCPKCERLY